LTLSQNLFDWFISDDFFAVILKGVLLLNVQIFFFTLTYFPLDLMPLWIMFVSFRHHWITACVSACFFGLVIDSLSSYPAGFYTSTFFLEFLIIHLIKEHLTWLRIQTWMYILFVVTAYQITMIVASRILIETTVFFRTSDLLYQILAYACSLALSYYIVTHYILRRGVLHEKAF
jgi:cell shape-determining protein MreD